MADKEEKFPENVKGKFYVDKKCIACVSCASLAPQHFKMFNGGEHALVVEQPRTESEVDLCRMAADVCPVDAIGSDGDILDETPKEEILQQP